jgi:hypothetical protein
MRFTIAAAAVAVLFAAVPASAHNIGGAQSSRTDSAGRLRS